MPGDVRKGLQTSARYVTADSVGNIAIWRLVTYHNQVSDNNKEEEDEEEEEDGDDDDDDDDNNNDVDDDDEENNDDNCLLISIFIFSHPSLSTFY